MDVQRILASVEERDKWRHRLEVLKAARAEVRGRRERLEAQLRSLKRELAHLSRLTDSLADTRRPRTGSPFYGAEEGHYPRR
jgi:uncharacterized coiled-coil DUF342 family protein